MPSRPFRSPELFQRRARHAPRPKQLHLGQDVVRRPRACIACARALPKGATACPDCGAFLCSNCDELTTPNGGDGERCFECLVYGKPAAE